MSSDLVDDAGKSGEMQPVQEISYSFQHISPVDMVRIWVTWFSKPSNSRGDCGCLWCAPGLVVLKGTMLPKVHQRWGIHESVPQEPSQSSLVCRRYLLPSNNIPILTIPGGTTQTYPNNTVGYDQFTYKLQFKDGVLDLDNYRKQNISPMQKSRGNSWPQEILNG